MNNCIPFWLCLTATIACFIAAIYWSKKDKEIASTTWTVCGFILFVVTLAMADNTSF